MIKIGLVVTIYPISGVFQGANHEKTLLIHPFDPRKGILQMDRLNYTNVECKDYARPIWFVVGCNNSATTYTRIELNDRIDGLIPVCDSCLPNLQSNQTHVVNDKNELFRGNQRK